MPAPDTPAPGPVATVAPEDQPSAAEIEQAAEDLRLAFALVADAQERAGRALRDKAGPIASALDTALPF